MKDSKYIFKENKTLLFRLTDRRVSLRIMKNKNHARTRIQTHKCNHTHIHANTQRRGMHIKTHACTRACVLACTHTHKVFFRDRRPEFVEPLATHCQGGWIQFLKQKRSYLVNLSQYRLVSEFVTVLLTLFDLFVVKYVAKCTISSYKTSVST